MSTSDNTQKNLYDLIAKTGDFITGLGILTGLGDRPSINDDSGAIAFVGQSNSLNDLLVENGLGQMANLSANHSNSFSTAVQINDQNQVIARDTLGGPSAIRIWDVNEPDSFEVLGTGNFPAGFDYNFESAFPFPSLNNNGQAVFLAIPKGQFPKLALETLKGNFFGWRTYNERLLLTGNARPMIADNGRIVARDPLSSITLFDYALNAVASIASSTSGFTSVGLSPGISDDGKVVTFYGELTQSGAEALGLTPGEGIFASIDLGSGSRKITRIAGLSGNGYLDPGETHEDANKNGKVDLGEDKGLITSFAKDERVGVGYQSLGDKNLGTVAYLAFDGVRESLLSSQFQVFSSDSRITHLQSNIVAQVGLPANIVSPDLTGVIQDLNIYDPVNDQGQVAFWSKTSTSTEAIVRANPVLKPVLIVPGIAGSFPKSNDYGDWLLNRGVEPTSLQPEQMFRTYDDLVETLKRAGYIEGVNLFVATYDWRLNPGPIDGAIDGKIHRSATELTDDTYEYSVDQLAFWMEEAVKGWRSQFIGVPESEIPELDSVDIIAHSAGGSPVRTYIQSDGYGQSFTFVDDNSNTVNTYLPKVNNFISLGVPYRGAAAAWNGLNNNFNNSVLLRLLGQILKSASHKVKNGQTIALSGSTEVDGAITPQEAEALGAIGFIEEYVPNLKALLATYPFIKVLSNNPSQTLQTAESLNPSQRNTLLLDLNNGFDAAAGGGDPNLFADLVQQVTVIYGTGRPARDIAIQKQGPDYFFTVPKPTILPFQNLLPVVPKPEDIWYDEEKGKADPQGNSTDGDGTIPVLSARGTFEGESRTNIQQKAFGVDHQKLMYDANVQQFILKTLGVDLDQDLISTNLNTSLPFDLFSAVSAGMPFGSIIFDPVEGFLVDGSGRRLGYSGATGPVTEIPNSVWLGGADGMGFFMSSLQGPFQLQLSGLGGEYFVSVSLEMEDSLGGIEVSGFLAQGEQKTFDIPVNKAPILDLNGSTDGVDFNTTGTLGTTVAIVDPSLVLTDSDSSNLQGATITLTNPTDGTRESLTATPIGNITAAYNPATHTLTLDGTDTIANYQQVLKTVTYTNTATTLNPLPRAITFVVDDGTEFNNLSPVAKTTLTVTAPPPNKRIEGTPGRDTLIGTNGNDIIIGFQGRDTLTGKGGNDQFVYNNLADKRDLITDFEVGKDKIVLTGVLDRLGYQGSDPLNDGIVRTISQRGNTFLQLDPDGFVGSARGRLFVQVIGVTEAALDEASNFVF